MHCGVVRQARPGIIDPAIPNQQAAEMMTASLTPHARQLFHV
jgi:hypothetical protein